LRKLVWDDVAKSGQYKLYVLVLSCGPLISMAQALMNLGYLYLKACCIACSFCAESTLYFENL